jgi:hypothetical protein
MKTAISAIAAATLCLALASPTFSAAANLENQM